MKVLVIILLCIIINTLNAQLTPVCFTTAGTPSVGLSPRCITTGDFNNDGKIDLAVGNYSSISVLLGTGTGSFASAVNFNVPSTIGSICSGDFDNDGNADLAIRSLSGSTGTINIVLSLGNGAFTSPVYSVSIFTSIVGSKNQIFCSDFNLDGNQDIMAGGSGNPQLFLGLGTCSFSAPITSGNGISFASCLAVGDFNNDTKPDFAYSAFSSGLSGVFLGTGTSSFVPTSTNIATHDFLTVGDYNNDTKIDLMFVDNGNFYTFFGNGTGYYPSGGLTASVTSFFANNVTSADFNGDGASDIAATDGSGVLGILLSSGWGFYRFAVGTFPKAIAAADFNGDGKVDIAVANGNSNNVSILINTTGGITPTINVVSTTSLLCSGQTATLTASGGVNYVWASGATTNTIGIVGSLTTTYLVTGTSPDGCAVNASITQSVSACLGVDELKIKDYELKIYPNPTNGILNLEVENGSRIKLINVLGELVKEEELKPIKQSIDISNLKNGIYFLQIYDKESLIGKTKIIKE
ncbi:MAG: FG-GAP-like repeat-containing protein [Bacteroidota bacterium]|nr:FG-GAP-like repeat-containing protein [Bacteroidota bacterium]